MGHIALSRAADLIVVCPATADLMARAATGQANDLASTLLLATDTPVLMVPAMNVRMWEHPATLRNLATLRSDGIDVMDPWEGEMACGEYGRGRLPPIKAIVARIFGHGDTFLLDDDLDPEPAGNLAGKTAIVTAGPTHEAIDPVRFLGNRSSGKQGFAIAAALAHHGARVTLIAGPVDLPTPYGVTRLDVVSARDMASLVAKQLPVDIAVMVAAVADWRVETAAGKLKKDGGGPPVLHLVENPDILATTGHSSQRPQIVIGFAAETSDLLANAAAKRVKKGADWIIANDVSKGVFGEDDTHVHLVTADGSEDWGSSPKSVVAHRLVLRIAEAFGSDAAKSDIGKHDH
jgi:phosphopantothenoylcysteine decarboxylase/phosphopantothenate--cysteine ligase